MFVIPGDFKEKVGKEKIDALIIDSFETSVATHLDRDAGNWSVAIVEILSNLETKKYLVTHNTLYIGQYHLLRYQVRIRSFQQYF